MYSITIKIALIKTKHLIKKKSDCNLYEDSNKHQQHNTEKSTHLFMTIDRHNVEHSYIKLKS